MHLDYESATSYVGSETISELLTKILWLNKADGEYRKALDGADSDNEFWNQKHKMIVWARDYLLGVLAQEQANCYCTHPAFDALIAQDTSELIIYAAKELQEKK